MSATPNVIRSTIIMDKSDHGPVLTLAGGSSFSQSFTADGAGVPKELGIVMGHILPRHAFGCRVQVFVHGASIFDHAFSGLVQEFVDDGVTLVGGAVVFSLASVRRSIMVGDVVGFTVTPDQDVHIRTLPIYGKQRAEFYLNS